jgi:ATP-dependent DNA ligase
MAAKTVTQLPVGPGWSFEPKYDGSGRWPSATITVCTCSSGSSRNLIAGFPDIAAAVAQLDEGVVLDGELVVWRAGRFRLRRAAGPAPLRVEAGALSGHRCTGRIRRLRPPRHDGRDQRDRPYRKRRRKLEKLLARGLPDGLVLTPATTDAAVASAGCSGTARPGLS